MGHHLNEGYAAVTSVEPLEWTSIILEQSAPSQECVGRVIELEYDPFADVE